MNTRHKIVCQNCGSDKFFVSTSIAFKSDVLKEENEVITLRAEAYSIVFNAGDAEVQCFKCGMIFSSPPNSIEVKPIVLTKRHGIVSVEPQLPFPMVLHDYDIGYEKKDEVGRDKNGDVYGTVEL